MRGRLGNRCRSKFWSNWVHLVTMETYTLCHCFSSIVPVLVWGVDQPFKAGFSEVFWVIQLEECMDRNRRNIFIQIKSHFLLALSLRFFYSRTCSLKKYFFWGHYNLHSPWCTLKNLKGSCLQQQQQQQRFYSHSPWISYIIPCLQFLGKLGRAVRITKGLDNRRARRWDSFLYLVCTYIE